MHMGCTTDFFHDISSSLPYGGLFNFNEICSVVRLYVLIQMGYITDFL